MTDRVHENLMREFGYDDRDPDPGDQIDDEGGMSEQYPMTIITPEGIGKGRLTADDVIEMAPAEVPILVLCQGEDYAIQLFGPFNSEEEAEVWIRQHNHDPYADDPYPSEDGQTLAAWHHMVMEKNKDLDHWCLMGEGHHEVMSPKRVRLDKPS